MKGRPKAHGWYKTTLLGKVVAVAYGCVPLYLVLVAWGDSAGLPAVMQGPVVGGMAVVLVCMIVAQRRGLRPFEQLGDSKGFTLVELLIVVSIIGLLAAILFPAFGGARNKAQFSRALEEFRSIYTALQLYSLSNNNQYPGDVNRGLPPGIQQYIAGGNWPPAPFPGSLYDWDAWAPSDLSYPPYNQVYQISVRFCSSPTSCNIPNQPWAAGFDYYSALYYCIQGPCRSHASQPVDYPGYCVNC